MITWDWMLRHGALLGTVLGLLCAVAVAGLRRCAFWLRARRDLAWARAQLGAPGGLPDTADGEPCVTLAGTVRVVTAERLDFGVIRDAAMVSVGASRRRRSYDRAFGSLVNLRVPRVMLETGRERVELVGPVHLLAGAREWFPAKRLRDLPGIDLDKVRAAAPSGNALHDFAVVLGVVDGDPIAVRGVLKPWRGSDAESPDGYRASAGAGARWQLEPASGDDTLAVAPLRVRSLTPFWRLLVWPMLLVPFTTGWGMLVASRYRAAVDGCRSGASCKKHGACSPSIGNLLAGEFSCAAIDSIDCRRSEACDHEGLCTTSNRTCIAVSKADCARSKACKSQYRCTPEDGLCALSVEDCARTPGCASSGACGYWEGSCVPASDADCVRGTSCRDLGWCKLAPTRRPQACVPGSDADCARSTHCKLYGNCALGDGPACVRPSGNHCALMDDCAVSGLCSVDQGGNCGAHTDADCKQSSACSRFGRCTAVDGKCYESVDQARCEGDCVRLGKCSLRGKVCAAVSDEACRSSHACRDFGQCRARGGQCVEAASR